MNPLLDFSGLPRFAEFNVSNVAPAVEQLLSENRALVARLVAEADAPTWDNFVQPLEDANERLSRAWGQVGHLNGVMNSPELREVYNANLPHIVQYYTELGQHQGLYEKYRQLKAAPSFSRLSPAQQKIVENELRDFRLGGAELPAEQKQRFMEISEELAATSSKFSDNLLDATNAFAHYVQNRDELAGLPDDVVETAQKAAADEGKPGYKLTLHAPCYLPVLQYAENRPLRELMYRAYVTRASEFGKAEWDNTAGIKKILTLRREIARLLGFSNYAELSLEPKMAGSPREVLDFLADLAKKARPFAERDLAELQAFAKQSLGMNELEAWDIGFASEKLRVARYAFSDQDVKQYFPETKVLPGMFKVVETLYDVRIKPADAPVWHPDVRFFNIEDRSGAQVGQFYLDLYARPSKRGGAWMDDAITRRRLTSAAGTNGIQAPVAYLTCNFSAPVSGKPAVFTHDEVITLFHEFGHGLHHLLTRVDELGVSGINGVEWDAVELPSQFMENFCWEWDVLKHMTAHVGSGTPASSEQGSRLRDANVRESGAAPSVSDASDFEVKRARPDVNSVPDGEPLPRSLFDKMLAAKNFQGGLTTARQIEFSLFDMRAHF
ncbi:MAG: M3 family metallopeptidase, partial [Burkholderiales bacterium]|nr:M3 family metallopeptidase [Burkholderiales bacterium]